MEEMVTDLPCFDPRGIKSVKTKTVKSFKLYIDIVLVSIGSDRSAMYFKD